VIIDSHVHLWRYDAVAYDWILPEERAIQRDFLIPELHAELDHAGMDGVIAVQARQTLAETRALFALADVSPRIHGVVGWVPLADPAIGGQLDQLGAAGPLVGVRHVVQGEPDDGFLDRPDIARGLAETARRGLAYDLLVRGHQLPRAIRCADAHPALRCVLDHVGKPRCGPATGLARSPAPAEAFARWSRDLRELARRPNVWCKLSGLAYEAGRQWSAEGLRPYLDLAVEAFGPRRLLFGSDWPVCLVHATYRAWLAAVRTTIAALSRDEQASILGDAACAAYRLDARAVRSRAALSEAKP
jgi:L-fuconolactonase